MYSTISELELHFSTGFLLDTSDDNDDGAWDNAVLTQAIVDADERLDVLLGLVYETPFTEPVPALIRELSSILAGENLARRIPSSPPIIYRGDFRRADALIDALAQRKVLLPDATLRTRTFLGDPPADERVFTRETLEAF